MECIRENVKFINKVTSPDTSLFILFYIIFQESYLYFLQRSFLQRCIFLLIQFHSYVCIGIFSYNFNLFPNRYQCTLHCSHLSIKKQLIGFHPSYYIYRGINLMNKRAQTAYCLMKPFGRTGPIRPQIVHNNRIF